MSVALSAFANTGGGFLIFGLKDTKKCQRMKWEVDDGGVAVRSPKGDTREWIENIIPVLTDTGLTRFNVYMIPSSGASDTQIHEGRALYVEIPESEQAPHQAYDKRYYARAGGRSVQLGHRLVMDIMGRRQHSKIELSFKIFISSQRQNLWTQDGSLETKVKLVAIARNTGRIFAQYVSVGIRVPRILLDLLAGDQDDITERNQYELVTRLEQNIDRDVVGWSGTEPEHGPGRFAPILPGLAHTWEIALRGDFKPIHPDVPHTLRGLVITWTAYADNAPR